MYALMVILTEQLINTDKDPLRRKIIRTLTDTEMMYTCHLLFIKRCFIRREKKSENVACSFLQNKMLFWAE